MSAPGCHSLWVLSLGQARESTSPFRAKLDDKKNTSPEWSKQADEKEKRSLVQEEACSKESVRNPAIDTTSSGGRGNSICCFST
jgi:hypothetical protein